MEHFDDVVTDRRLTLAAVEGHLATIGEQPELFAGEYLCLASGGSSGRRGVFVLSWDALADMNLAILRPSMARLLAAGGSPQGGLTIGVVCAPTAIHATGAGSAIMGGGMIRVINAPATLPVDQIVARLNNGQPQILVGYAGIPRVLADEKVTGRLTIAPISIGSTSEQLTTEVSAAIEGAFGVPVSNTFGSSEGLFGAADPGDEVISLATDLAIVELVDERNRPVPAGTPSARVLITNLSNLAQPLIRYELTDSFVQQPPASNHGHLRVIVAGRTDEAFTYSSTAIQPLVMRSPLVKTPQVTEYQVRQTARGVDLDVVVNAPVDERALATLIARSLGEAGLPDAAVTIRVVERIERDARTGKVRRFVPLT
jgi:phenylacetate-coenzyme A ligase PaaK-like adenylate-forming protein